MASNSLGTIAVHNGNDPKDWNCQSTSPAIVTSTSFIWDEPTKPGLFEYSRLGNPTRSCLQRVVASLERVDHAFAVTSGSNAVIALVQALLKAGDKILLPRDAYYGTRISFMDVLAKFNVSTTLVDAMSVESIESAITDSTKIVWIDCPSNPLLRIMDIKKLSEVVHEKDCLLVVDGTFMTPYFQQPLVHGADVVMHSATKFINGHGDVLMGLIATNSSDIAASLLDVLSDVGTVPSAFDCYLMIRGIKTLRVRMKEHERNAFAVARFLESSPFVEEVIYPGLPSHPDHQIAKVQCTGFGGMVSFKIKGDLENGKKFMKSLKLFTCAVSLGGLESLADLCASMTRKGMPREDRLRAGIPDNLIRLSIGLEDTEDILNDLDQALKESQFQ